jgi:hypothetical protein
MGECASRSSRARPPTGMPPRQGCYGSLLKEPRTSRASLRTMRWDWAQPRRNEAGLARDRYQDHHVRCHCRRFHGYDRRGRQHGNECNPPRPTGLLAALKAVNGEELPGGASQKACSTLKMRDHSAHLQILDLCGLSDRLLGSRRLFADVKRKGAARVRRSLQISRQLKAGCTMGDRNDHLEYEWHLQMVSRRGA